MNQSDKLITEYPLRQAVGIYLGMWKRLFYAMIKGVAVVALLVIGGQLFGSLILATAFRTISAGFWSTLDFMVEHRILTFVGVVMLAAIIIVARTARSTNPTKW